MHDKGFIGREAAFTDADFPADEYPGARPDISFVHTGGVGLRLDPDAASPSGWRVAGGDLDDWLLAAGASPVAARLPMLAYGSNACPSKITWLREVLGLLGPAVVLQAEVDGLAAVWAAGLRDSDGQRPATIMAAPGIRERHAVWLLDSVQLAALDVCEGRGKRYRLVRLSSGQVSLPDGSTVFGILGYAGLSRQRLPLYVAGAPVRCAELGQADAVALRGEPGPDNLVAGTVIGSPFSGDPNSGR